MRANEVEKEDESGDGRVSGIKRIEAAFSFVPSLELTVKGFDEIVRNIVIEALDTNMFSDREKTFDWYIVSGVTVADNGSGVTKLICVVHDDMCLL